MRLAIAIPFILAASACVAQIPAESPDNLVRKVIAHELEIDKQDHSHWMYQDIANVPEPEKCRTVVETANGNINYTSEIDHQPLSPDQRKVEDERVRKFVADPDQQRKARNAGAADDKKSEQMMAMLPDAFLFQVASKDGDNETLNFRPNPAFTSHSGEAYVLHKMDGFVIINTKDNRLVEISGKLTHGVEFAGGLLGHLAPGGTFDVQRKEVAPGHWAVTRLKVDMKGKILFFKTIAELQDEVSRHFERVPDNLTLAQAEAMAEKQEGPAAVHGGQ